MNDSKDGLLAPSAKPGASSRTMAIEWAAYLQSGLASDADLSEFHSWFRQSEKNRSAFRNIMQMWEDVGLAAMMSELVEEERELARKNNIAFRFSRRWAVPVAIAASTLFAVGSVFWGGFSPKETHFQYETLVGEIRSVSLEDGTVIILGGATTLTGQLSGSAREIEMQTGRAYFDIASETERPFRVNTGQTTIEVLGTEFDVNFGSDAITISVEEGRVQIFSAGERAGLSDAVLLNEGEQIRTSWTGETGIVQKYNSETLSWRNGQLSYVDARLEDVIEEVNRYRRNKIRIADAGIEDLRVSFSVPAGQTDTLLAGLEATLPIRVQRVGGGATLYRNDRK